MKHQRVQRTLKLEQAMMRMRAGARLVLMHSASGGDWFVVPGGPVTEVVAKAVRQRPDVVGSADGLFPDHDQTWRMLSFASAS